MEKWLRLLLQAIIYALPPGGVAAVATRWFREWKNGTLVSPAPEIYAGLLVVCIVLIVKLNWPWIDSWRPSTRFRKLHPEIDLIHARCIHEIAIEDAKSWGHHHPDFPVVWWTAETARRIELLAMELEKLGIPHPPASDIDSWPHRLEKLKVDAEQRALRQSRKEQ